MDSLYSENEWQDFYKNYRESLSKQYETGLQNLNQQRRNAMQTIMSGANKAGMLYSSFIPREKIKYDTDTYQPAQIKLQNTYQTGLNQLQSNILNYQNSIKEIQDAINHLNSMT